MLTISGPKQTGFCDGMTRRDWLRVGALGVGALALPNLLRFEATQASEPRRTSARAQSVIMLFLSGGPSHLDMWDLKPEAPEEIRGTFKPAATRTPPVKPDAMA